MINKALKLITFALVFFSLSSISCVFLKEEKRVLNSKRVVSLYEKVHLARIIYTNFTISEDTLVRPLGHVFEVVIPENTDTVELFYLCRLLNYDQFNISDTLMLKSVKRDVTANDYIYLPILFSSDPHYNLARRLITSRNVKKITVNCLEKYVD